MHNNTRHACKGQVHHDLNEWVIRVITLVRRAAFQQVGQIKVEEDRREIWLEVTSNDGSKFLLVNIYSEWL
jgi:hypothetical protein